MRDHVTPDGLKMRDGLGSLWRRMTYRIALAYHAFRLRPTIIGFRLTNIPINIDPGAHLWAVNGTVVINDEDEPSLYMGHKDPPESTY